MYIIIVHYVINTEVVFLQQNDTNGGYCHY